MQYHVQTAEEYLSVLEDDWRREKLLEIRRIILECGPHLKEGIEYGMLCYRDERGGVLALNAQKRYVALYVADAKKVDPDGTLLAGLDVRKSCIRFTKSKAVGDARIREVIQRALAIRQQDGDIDC